MMAGTPGPPVPAPEPAGSPARGPDMRAWIIPVAAVAGVVGCGSPVPDVPMTTDGPNQVVLKVPAMT